MELVIALILLVIVGYPVYRKLQRASPTSLPDTELLNNNNEWDSILAFQGESEFRTDTFEMETGNYKLMYWFPEEVLVKVELFSAAGDEHETLVMKRGTGETSFSVEAGRYFCLIEPTEESAEWEVEISPLGLPSASPRS